MNFGSEQKVFQLKNGSYFIIVNKATQKALQVNQAKDYKKQHIFLNQPNQKSIGQIWMIQQVKPHQWEIVHAKSTLVLQNDTSQMRLHFGTWKSSQLFFLHKSDPKNNPNQFWIKQNKASTKLLFYDDLTNKLMFKQRDYDDPVTKWQLFHVTHNDTINQSCYIQYAYSNQVLDVPQASQKLGQYIIQYPLNKRFNQRWKLEKRDGYYLIQNVKTKLFLDIKNESQKQGGWIIQWKQTGGKNQLWSIQQQGKRLYLIRSALDKSLLLGINGNSLKQKQYVVTTKSQAQAMWKIIGRIPK